MLCAAHASLILSQVPPERSKVSRVKSKVANADQIVHDVVWEMDRQSPRSMKWPIRSIRLKPGVSVYMVSSKALTGSWTDVGSWDTQ